MRNIAEILEDDKNGKQLSHTERQIAVAYMQGKYDAVRELKIGNSSNTNEVLDKIRAEIDKEYEELDGYDPHSLGTFVCRIDDILDKYKGESEEQIGEIT